MHFMHNPSGRPPAMPSPSLRALGVGMGSLRRIVVELSFWVGVVGVAAEADAVDALGAVSGRLCWRWFSRYLARL